MRLYIIRFSVEHKEWSQIREKKTRNYLMSISLFIFDFILYPYYMRINQVYLLFATKFYSVKLQNYVCFAFAKRLPNFFSNKALAKIDHSEMIRHFCPFCLLVDFWCEHFRRWLWKISLPEFCQFSSMDPPIPIQSFPRRQLSKSQMEYTPLINPFHIIFSTIFKCVLQKSKNISKKKIHNLSRRIV